MMDSSAIGIIFSNMHDDYMGELTNHRTMASIPFGGRYRLVDFALSNMVNSGIQEVGVITKSNYQSLMDHLGSGREWDLARKRGGLCLLPPYASAGSTGVYRGRLDALANIIGYIQRSSAKYVVISDCDVVANIDLKKVIRCHAESGAQITLLYSQQAVTADVSHDITLLEMDVNNRVCDVRINPMASGVQNVYMDIAVIEKELLEKIIMDGRSRNQLSFRRDVLVAQKDKINICAYEFDKYIVRINNLNSYYEANMSLLHADIRSELFPPLRPVRTKVRDEVPVKYGLAAKVTNSLLADGCIIEGEVENSILFRGVKVGRGAKIKNCILMQGTVIGDGASMDYVVADKDVTVRDTRTLMGYVTYPLYIAKGSMV
ncbi:MAG: glucose-1-phosphate adenylyltransferase subunit GlgD [Oscillospiraceae bacterium]|nr:glucose-1-phosphate adenylyltransferase subunit GlgD [Oscillospiraceae bacterium]